MLTIARVLVAGGDEPSLQTLQQVLETAGHIVSRASGVEDAGRRIAAGEVDVAVLGSDALTALERLADAQCGSSLTSFIAFGAMSAAETREVLRAGVSDVLEPASGEHALIVGVERAAREAQLKRELAMLRARVGDVAHQSLVGRSAAMVQVRELLGRAAGARVPVLITGESGVGKNVVARLVHDLSERAPRPLVTVHCASSDADALELELFGRAGIERGRPRAGLLEEARGGTIILDEAAALPAALQARLVRASATRTTHRVGGSETIAIDTRLVLILRTNGTESAAHSIDGFLARFNAMVIEVPPLRDRRSDIPQLVQHFRQRLAAEHGLELAPLSPDEMLPLLGRDWPGNVRELEHWVERDSLEARVEQPRAESGAIPGVDLGTSRVTLEQLERAYIYHVLALESGHQSRTAARLGIDRRTLYRKLKQYRST
jgi:DNA-binding NtrC family response regulator